MRLILILCLFWFHTAWTQNLKVGVAKRMVTPDPLLPVSGGIGTPKSVKEKKGELSIRAVVIRSGDEKVAWVSIDNLGWPAALGNKTRALLPDFKHILISATHTHSAPDAYAFPDETGHHYADLEYLDRCTRIMAECIIEAEKTQVDAEVKVSYGKAANGIAYNYYAPDLYDPNVGVIQFLNGEKPIATLVNYAIHPEVIGSKQGILSPDLCGPLYDYIEEKGGGMGMFINGAQGGMVTADNRRKEGEVNTWEECQRIGRLLGSEALRLLQVGKRVDQPLLKIRSQILVFPVENPQMKYILEKSPLGYGKGNQVETVQYLIELGPVKILTIPGEALPNIGYYLKRKMNTPYPFLFGLTNDAFGYILSKVDYDSFEKYSYITRTSLGESTGEILIERSLELIKK
ncbi:hypothetical protein [Leadbetterella byssophila]|uniref:hypothetical protein n=1 Tax=Leadbetterella byssophila TaxID=316068 RepID=UPI00399FFB22